MLQRTLSLFLAFCLFFANTPAFTQDFRIDQLPLPGTMVMPSLTHVPVMLTGLKVDPKHPLNFDFVLDQGDSDVGVGNRHAYSLQDESAKLIKYFLTALTIPEGDLWVNLSPSDWVK